MILLASILLFLASTALVAGVAVNQRAASTRALTVRVSRPVSAVGQAPAELRRDTRLSSIPWLDRSLRTLALGPRLELLLYQAGMSVRPGVVVLASAAAFAGGMLAGLLIVHRLWVALILAVLAALLPWLMVERRKHARMTAFSREFPDALGLLVSALRGGLSFSAALQVVSDESPEPVRGEFAIAVEEQSLGLDFRESMERLCRRVDALDLRFFVTAVMLQRETGGNLAEVLSNTAELIRERFRVLGDIKTMTAQGKMTGAILVVLPVLMALATFLMAPDYFTPMIENPTGRVALWIAGGMQLLGVYVCYRIVNIRV